MPYDLSRTLVVGVSATALFDLSEADAVFRTKVQNAPDEAIDAYRKYMLGREDEPLAPGTSYSLVKALLDLNKYKAQDQDPPLVEVVVLSRNSPETGVRVLKTIRRDGLAISRSVFTGGEPVVDYLDAFDVDLFLTTSAEDAQKVIDSAVCPAALVYPPPSDAVQLPENQVRIAFDGDAVLFSATGFGSG
jgi:5'-nucleotidase